LTFTFPSITKTYRPMTHRFPLKPLAVLVLAACLPIGSWAQSTDALQQRLDQLASELAAVKAELETVKQKQASTPAPAAIAQADAPAPRGEPDTVWSS
jgi:septal ring factor EnvC (AmiA/AmiB activator)